MRVGRCGSVTGSSGEWALPHAFAGEVPGTVAVVEEKPAVTALELDGEFDVGSSEQLAEHVEGVLGAGRDLIIDLSQVGFIDSSVIHLLFRTAADARARGRMLVLQLGTAPGVERLIEITGVEREIPCTPTRQGALELIAAGRPDSA